MQWAQISNTALKEQIPGEKNGWGKEQKKRAGTISEPPWRSFLPTLGEDADVLL